MWSISDYRIWKNIIGSNESSLKNEDIFEYHSSYIIKRDDHQQKLMKLIILERSEMIMKILFFVDINYKIKYLIYKQKKIMGNKVVYKDTPETINQLKATKAELAKLAQQITNSNQSMAEFQKRQLATQRQLKNINEQYESSKKQIANLTSMQNQYKTAQGEIETLRNQYKTAQGQISALKTKAQQIQKLNKQYTEAQEKYQKTLSQLTTITKQYESSKSQISSLTTQYNFVNYNLTSMQNQYRTAQSQIGTLTNQYNTAQGQIFTLNTNYTQAQQQIKNLNSQFTEAQNKLGNLTIKYNLTIEEMKSLKDPQKIKENYNKIFLNFLNQLQSFNIYNPIPKQGNVKYVAILGETSAGKTTIYNKLFGLNLKTGQNQTTQNIEIIFKDEQKNRVYFDVPGFNEVIEIVDPSLLHAFYKIDCVFIVTDRTFKFSKRAIQVMNQINPPQLTMVRTKCDLFTSDSELQEVKNQDRANLASFGVTNREILYISSFKPDTFIDNLRFEKMIKGE